jgi:preprotein translocase subunit SecG
MMFLLTFLHVLVCFALIGVVLLQSGKGAEMGASFGAGGSQSVFGASGGSTFLSKLTTGAAIIFMLTSLTLAYLSGNPSSSSIMAGKSQKPAPAKQSAPQQPAPQPVPQQTPAAPQPTPAPPAGK